MRLDNFLKKDMEEFLEKKAAQIRGNRLGSIREEEMGAYSLTEDYEQEMQGALQAGNIRQARKIFLDLRDEFIKFPDGSAGQRKSYEIMIVLESLVRDYLENNDLENLPKSPKKIGIVVPPRPQGMPKTVTEKREEDKRIMSDVKRLLQEIDDLMDKGRVKEAANNYEDAKRLFIGISDETKDEKKAVYDEILAAFYEIRKASNKIASERKKELLSHARKVMAGEEESIEPEDENEIVPTEKLLGKIEDVRILIKEQKAREAIEGYDELKKMFRRIDESGETKRIIFKDILSLFYSLKNLENYLMRKKQRARSGKSIIDNEDNETLSQRIKREKRKALNFINEGKAGSAQIQYNKIKEIMESLPDGDDKVRLGRDLDVIAQQINGLKDKKPGTEINQSGHIEKMINETRNLLDSGKVEDARRSLFDLQKEVIKSTEPPNKKDEYRKIISSLNSRIQNRMISDNMKAKPAEA